MNKYFADVEKFHTKFGLPKPGSFSLLEDDLFAFRVNFLQEEFDEYVESHEKNDLPTAIDSLIDLVYIVCGTLSYHGMNNEDVDWLFQNFECEDILKIDLMEDEFDNEQNLHLLKEENFLQLKSLLQKNINDYKRNQNNHYLAAIYTNCLFGSSLMGMTEECWDEFWDDVQAANMRKIKADGRPTKRGTPKFDIIKPDGWIGPDSESLVEKYNVEDNLDSLFNSRKNDL